MDRSRMDFVTEVVGWARTLENGVWVGAAKSLETRAGAEDKMRVLESKSATMTTVTLAARV